MNVKKIIFLNYIFPQSSNIGRTRQALSRVCAFTMPWQTQPSACIIVQCHLQAVIHLTTKFHAKSCTTFWVVLLTDMQTNRQERKHTVFVGGNELTVRAFLASENVTDGNAYLDLQSITISTHHMLLYMMVLCLHRSDIMSHSVSWWVGVPWQDKRNTVCGRLF